MATIKAVSSKATLKRATDYVLKKEKTNDDLIDGINCNPNTARIEMETIQRGYGKTDGKVYYHYTLNYHKDDNITPEQCLKNAKRLCEETDKFKGHQVLIVVHTDKPHKHAHIIVSSVNAESGKKLQFNPQDLRDFKRRSDEICREQGLKITEKGKTFEGKENGNTSTYTKEAYKSVTDEKSSWVVRTGLAVMECKEQATSREDFIEKMKEKGYEVKWTDRRKDITFIDTERQKAGEKKFSIRDKKLEEHFHINFGKESLTNEFEANVRSQAERTTTAELERRGQEAISRVYKGIGDSTAGEGARAEQSRPVREQEQGTGRRNIQSESQSEIEAIRSRQMERITERVRAGIETSKQRRADIERDKREAEAERSKSGRTGTEREPKHEKRRRIERER